MVSVGARRHEQEGALAPSGNVILSCASVITAKRLLDELFMRYFSQHVVRLWGIAPPPRRLHLWRLLGDFPPQTPHLITPGKKSCGRPGSSLQSDSKGPFHQRQLATNLRLNLS